MARLQSTCLLFVTALLLTTVFATAQSAGSDAQFKRPQSLPLSSFYETPHPLIAGKPGELIRSEPADNYHLPYELSVVRILYHSRTLSGEDSAASGVVLVPEGKPPAEGWPVIAWAHEFRGMKRENAPSLMKNLSVGPMLAMYANLGYAVVATDYAGWGTRGDATQDMESNALDVIYSIAAARTAVPEVGSKWIAVGSGQGAFAVLRVAETDVHDSGFLGSIAVPGLTDKVGALAVDGHARGPAAHTPLLVIASQADHTTAADTTEKIVARMCKQGDRVLFLRYPDIDAGGAIGASISDQISWIKARFAGYTAPSNCH